MKGTQEPEGVSDLSYQEKFFQLLAPYNSKFAGEKSYTQIQHLPVPKHIFPVVDAQKTSGLMVPFIIKPAVTWHISDAFGRFAGKEKDSSVWDSFVSLIHLIQNKFCEKLGEDQPIAPILFRYAFDISLSVPVHMEVIAGKSLQLPLIVALCREIAEQGQEQCDPLEGPIFCSGQLLEQGKCAGQLFQVNNIIEKAAGFVREYGSGYRAILPLCHKTEMDEIKAEQNLFSKIYYLKSIEDLLDKVPGLKESLQALPHITEMNRLIQEMQSHRTSLNFEDAALFQQWLKISPSKSKISTYYRVHILLSEMQLLNSKGHPLAAQKVATQINKKIALSRIGSSLPLGRDCKLQFHIENARSALACLNIEGARESLESQLDYLDTVSPVLRAHFQATYGRYFHFAGQIDKARYYYEEAIATADFGNTDYSGQYRNYLIHTLLKQAEQSDGAKKQNVLTQAKSLLVEAETHYMPRTTKVAENNHILFCKRLHSQIAWLRRERYTPTTNTDSPYKQARLYLYFNCARNSAHSLEERIDYCRRIATRVDRVARVKADVLNYVDFLRGISRMYYHALLEDQKGVASWREYLLGNSLLLKRNGFPHWHTLLARHMPFSEINVVAIEKLVKSIPYF